MNAVGGAPVALPRVHHFRVVDAVQQRLVVQEVEHVLDGERERRAAVRRAEDGLEQVVHVLLQRTLGKQRLRSVQGRAMVWDERVCRIYSTQV